MRPPEGEYTGCRRACLLPILLVFLLALPWHGVEAITNADTLHISWNKLTSQLEAHAGMVSGRAATRIAQGLRREAGAIPNPSWEVNSFSVDPRNGADPSREEDLTLTFPVDWIWNRPGQLKAARAVERRSQAELELLRRDLLLQAGEAFWTLARDQALAEATGELDAQMQELLRAVSTRVRLGEARPVEAARAEVEALQASLEAAAARNALTLSQELLMQWMPAGEARVPVVDADMMQLPAAPAIDAPMSALLGHPRLAAAEAGIEAERGVLNVERMKTLPRLELRGSLERAEDLQARGVGLGVELPIFNWNRGRIDQAAARVQQAEADLAAERLRVDGEMATAVAAFATSSEAARVHREQILPRAKQAAEMLESTWRLGEAGLFEVIDARRTLWATRRQAIEVFCRAQLDRLSLQLLIGKESN